ncbi:hypothetical protein pb186bvf_004512 [Paramecium bursaria]
MSLWNPQSYDKCFYWNFGDLLFKKFLIVLKFTKSAFVSNFTMCLIYGLNDLNTISIVQMDQSLRSFYK